MKVEPRPQRWRELGNFTQAPAPRVSVCRLGWRSAPFKVELRPRRWRAAKWKPAPCLCAWRVHEVGDAAAPFGGSCIPLMYWVEELPLSVEALPPDVLVEELPLSVEALPLSACVCMHTFFFFLCAKIGGSLYRLPPALITAPRHPDLPCRHPRLPCRAHYPP